MDISKYKKYIPNIFTLTNMSLGLASILFLIQSEHRYKAIVVPCMILLGGIADFFDGFFARKLTASSEMGKQLDSFADIITFGIAPVALINYLSVCALPFFIILPSLLFVLAGAYRLARYNLNDFSSHFMGLPITAAGILLAVYCAAYPFWADRLYPGICTAITASFVVLLSAAMISKKKFRRFSVKKSGT